MMYVAKVDFVDDFDDNGRRTRHTSALFITGKSYTHVMAQLAKFYGDDNIESVKLELFSPDNFLEFGYSTSKLEEMELFTEVERVIGDKVFW